MTLQIDHPPNLFDRFNNLMNQKTKGVKIGCYSIAFIGLAVAMRRVRPFSRFKKPTDIPKRFVKERRELVGDVERIEPNGALLMINHQPLVMIPGIRQGQLPVKIASINVTGHGISWLQTLVAGNEVKFVPVHKAKDYVECEIKMPQRTHDNKLRTIDLGESLVRIGFGTIIERPIGKKNPNYPYYLRLKAAEDAALRKKMGVKYYVKPTKIVLAYITKVIYKMFVIIFRKIMSTVYKKQIVIIPKLALS